MRWSRRILDWGPPLVVALAAWLIFRPGLLSPDSLDQYRQALVGRFDDWHPPILAIVLWTSLRSGAGISFLMFVQALALAGAAYAVLVETRWRPTDDSPKSGTVIPFFVLLVVTPPFLYYAMTFWKDCWAAIGLLLMTAFGLRAARRPTPATWFGMLAASVFTALARHNAVVLLPLAGIILAWTPSSKATGSRWTRRLAAILLPLACFLLVRAVLYRIADVQRRDIGAVVMAHELAIACRADPEVALQSPYAAEHLASRYSTRAGNPDNLSTLVDQVWWLGPDVLDTIDESEVQREYGALVVRHPGLLLRLKIWSWIRLLNIESTPFWHQEILEPNELELALNPEAVIPRSALAGISRAFLSWSPTRLIFGSHLIWLLAGTLLAARAAIHMRQDRTAIPQFFIALIPLVYAATFLAAYAVPDFRYLYPATLTIQVALLGRAAGRFPLRPFRCS